MTYNIPAVLFNVLLLAFFAVVVIGAVIGAYAASQLSTARQDAAYRHEYERLRDVIAEADNRNEEIAVTKARELLFDGLSGRVDNLTRFIEPLSSTGDANSRALVRRLLEMRAALEDLGVRQSHTQGERVEFDPLRAVSAGESLAIGDAVRVIEAGWEVLDVGSGEWRVVKREMVERA